MVVDLPCDWQLKCADMNKRAGQILEAELWTDCSFVVGSEQQTELKAHKLLLAMSSPVFAAMFYGPIAERGTSVTIPDVEPDVFKCMLKFMYGNEILIDSVELAISLLFVAQKYMLPGLFTICTEYLGGHLTPEIVCRVYEVALMIDAENLRIECEKKIKAKPTKALTSDAFLDLNMDTVLKIFSFEKMNIDSELILIQAADHYNEALKAQRVDMDISEAIRGNLCNENSQEISVNRAGGEKVYKAVEVSKDLSGCSKVTLEDKEDGITVPGTVLDAREVIYKEKLLPPVDRPILPVLQKIRFLTLTHKQLTEEASVVSLLTADEMAAIYNNISAEPSQNTLSMPKGFSINRTMRKIKRQAVSKSKKVRVPQWECRSCQRLFTCPYSEHPMEGYCIMCRMPILTCPNVDHDCDDSLESEDDY